MDDWELTNRSLSWRLGQPWGLLPSCGPWG
jgi:hypothetical protein